MKALVVCGICGHEMPFRDRSWGTIVHSSGKTLVSCSKLCALSVYTPEYVAKFRTNDRRDGLEGRLRGLLWAYEQDVYNPAHRIQVRDVYLALGLDPLGNES